MAHLAKSDIILLTETWLVSYGDENPLDFRAGQVQDVRNQHWDIPGFTHLHMCKQHRRGKGRQSCGISLYIRNGLDQHASVVAKDMAAGILWVRFKNIMPGMGGRDILLAACYFPPESNADHFGALTTGIAEYGSDSLYLVVGDLNARTGTLSDILLDNVHGLQGAMPRARRNCDAVVNVRGSGCIDFCIGLNLLILNGRSRGDINGAMTYKAANGGMSAPDIFIASRELFCKVKNLTVGCVHEWAITSDHAPVNLILTGTRWDGRPISNSNVKCSQPVRRVKFVHAEWTKYSREIGRQEVASKLSINTANLVSGVISGSKAAEILGKTLKECQAQAFTCKTLHAKHASWWDNSCADEREKLRKVLRVAYRTEPNLVKKARKIYQLFVNDRKQTFRQQRLAGNMETYFKDPKSFFQNIQPAHRPCPIQDLDGWKTHFDRISNTPINGPVEAGPPIITPDNVFRRIVSSNTPHFLNSSVVAARRAAAEGLNTDFEVEEVVAVIGTLKNHKATDPSGLIAELFKYAVEISPTHNAKEGIGKCSNLVATHITALCNHILHSGTFPSTMTMNDLIPIFKKGDPLVMDNYRGITISSILSKIYSAVWEKRLSRWAEEQNLRSPTQFGFRAGLGTLHNIFLLRHLVDRRQGPIKKGGHGKPLYVCFIDFEKAFDSAAREYIFRRLEERGVHGVALDAIKAMFKDIKVRVKAGGKRSGAFSTIQGVKQGDPLSPFLFGIFVEILHDMLQTFCPEAGIKVGSQTIFDMLYADDSTLTAESPEALQSQLDVVKMFCRVFGMKVNVRKTEIMVFRSQGLKIPEFVWHYDGNVVKVVESAVYLGYPLHAQGIHMPWDGKLRDSGLKASFALRGLVLKHDLYAPELQLRLFDTLVKPVMSYGCQIWGADYSMYNTVSSALNNPLQRVHLNYLRLVSGASPHVPNIALLHEFKAAPLVCYWLRLVLRFWNQIVLNTHWLLHAVLLDNVGLAKSGLESCWSAKVITTLRKLGVMTDLSHSVADICRVVDVDEVVERLNTRIFQCLWATHLDPRSCPSIGAKHCLYMRWFAHTDTHVFHPHITCTDIEYGKHRQLMRFRMGCADIAVNAGRFVKPKKERANRLCKCCSLKQAEDELHVVFRCPAYNRIRSSLKYSALFVGIVVGDMLSFFNECTRQSLLADFIRTIEVARKRILTS